ncbi:MAG: HAMP domain-containing sensor histidine kinase, partial [Ginsengibacter sp.]
QFDSVYNASQWWSVSSEGMVLLRNQQRSLWKSVHGRMKELYNREQKSKDQLVSFIILAILLVLAFVVYLINHIKRMLSEIKVAAAVISRGGSKPKLNNMPKGIIGNLAQSIQDIDNNNLTLANAASQIGKGNFDVKVQPRSKEDILGISIVKMQKDLYNYASQKDRIQKETEELVYRRDEFFSIASHELKTPVTSLKAYTQLLLMESEGKINSQYRSMLERMDRQINKLTALINDILDTSKLDNGELVYRKEKIPLINIVVDAITDIKRTSPQHEIIFNSYSNAEINADADRISQVLNNFLTNAIKYAADSPNILVELKQEGDKVICSVQDFGKGIAEEEQQKIFDRFYRVTGPNLNTYPGLGLGLFICKDIIEKHQGKIGVISELGNGCTFYFELPVAE